MKFFNKRAGRKAKKQQQQDPNEAFMPPGLPDPTVPTGPRPTDASNIIVKTVKHIPPPPGSPPEQQQRDCMYEAYHPQQQQQQQYHEVQAPSEPQQEAVPETAEVVVLTKPEAPPARKATPPVAKPTSSTPSSAAVPEESALISPEHQLARADRTRELVKRFISEIWNRGDLNTIEVICSKNLRFNGSVGFDRVGHDGFAKMVTTIREGLTEYHCEIHSIVAEGNKAFCRLRFTGKHTGPLLGYPPTNRVVAWMGASEFTTKGSLIVKVWELGDFKSLEDQLKRPREGM